MIEQAQSDTRPALASFDARIMRPDGPQSLVRVAELGRYRRTRSWRAGSRSPRPQPVQDGRVGAGHVHDLPPACRSRDQCHGVTADTERIGYRGQRCRGSPPVHGPRGYPYHEGAIVLTADARTRGSGADPDR